jgi:uncharacterized protein GlcG (DUF336 family)
MARKLILAPVVLAPVVLAPVVLALFVLALFVSMWFASPGLAQSTGPALMTIQAIRMIERVRAYARAHDLKLGIAVVDAEGQLVAAVRMDGAPPRVMDHALADAKKAVSDASSDVRGGRPIMIEGRRLGALGASGADDTQTGDAVRDGLKAIEAFDKS